MPTSAAPLATSAAISVAGAWRSAIWSPGCARWNAASAAGSRGVSIVVAATRTRPRVAPAWRSSAARACATSARIASARGSSSSPAGVSSAPRGVRRSSSTPSSASSRRTCCESADCVIHSSSAARVNCPWRATATKYSSRRSSTAQRAVQPASITNGAPVNAEPRRAEQEHDRAAATSSGSISRLSACGARITSSSTSSSEQRRAPRPGRRAGPPRAACGRSRGRSRSRVIPLLGALQRERLDQPEHAVLRRHVAGLERRRDEPMRGRDREEAPVAARGQRLPAVAGEQERAREQQREQRVPAVLVELGDRRDVLEAGVGDDRVEPAERGDRALDGGPVAGARGQVGGERLARARPGSGSRSTESTCAPDSTSAAATARPMPLAAPVTIACLLTRPDPTGSVRPRRERAARPDPELGVPADRRGRPRAPRAQALRAARARRRRGPRA